MRGHNHSGKRGELCHNWKGGISSNCGYIEVLKPNHPCASGRGYIRRSHLVAESVLDKPFPKGAVVHHINGIETDDRKSNLVICQDNAYHMMLHYNKTALNQCGHKNWRRCGFCHKYDDPKNLLRSKCRTIFHQECRNKHARNRYWEQKHQTQMELSA